jgi:Tol biopolymer transport system component
MLDLNNFYAWPTWSPDGTKLAASRVQVIEQRAEVTLEVIDPSNGRAVTIFKNETPALVADGAPHYIYWAPDSKSLAFLASTRDGLTLYVGDTETDSEPTGVAVGAPLYFQWAANSESILVHVGEELKLITKPFGAASQSLLPADLGFRVPALSPDGKRMAYSGSGESMGFLIVGASDAKDDGHRALELGIRSAFAWSPNGEQLAVVDQDNPRAPSFQRLRVVAEDGSQERTLAEGHIMAFYWSPNGDQLAWVTLDVEDREFVWWAGPSSGGEAHLLFKFQPSSEVLMMLSFFDQYAYSHSPWSPDGSRLVVAGVRGQPSERRNGSAPTGALVFVLQADGSAEPRELAAGSLAFWSWN